MLLEAVVYKLKIIEVLSKKEIYNNLLIDLNTIKMKGFFINKNSEIMDCYHNIQEEVLKRNKNRFINIKSEFCLGSYIMDELEENEFKMSLIKYKTKKHKITLPTSKIISADSVDLNFLTNGVLNYNLASNLYLNNDNIEFKCEEKDIQEELNYDIECYPEEDLVSFQRINK